jgi:O-antigen/teichoic acid export membrane protein
MKKSGSSPGETSATDQPILAHRAASGAIWIAFEMGSTQLASLLVFAVMARFVTPTDFGLISISYLAIYTFKSLVIDNIAVAVSRKAHPSDLEYTTSFWLTLAFSAVASVALLLSAATVEQLMGAPGLTDVMRAMSVILLFMGLARTHEMRLIRSFQFRPLVLRNILGAVGGGGIGIGLAVNGHGLAALIIQQIATSGISLALLWLFSSWSPSVRASKKAIIEILYFMRTIAPTSIISVVNQNCDTFLVAYFFGPASAGAYSVAKRLRLALQLVAATPVSGVLFSTLAEVQDDRGRLKNVSQRLIALISLVCAPIFVGSSSIAYEIISAGFGTQWKAASPIFAVLTLGGFFVALQSFGDTLFILKNRQVWSFYLLLIQTFLIVLAFFPSSTLGPEYIAVPFIAPFVMTFPLSAIAISRLTGLSFFEWSAAIVPSLASSAVMFIAVKSLGSAVQFSSDLVQAIVCSATGAIIYLAGMLVLSRKTVIFTLRTLRDLIQQRH